MLSRVMNDASSCCRYAASVIRAVVAGKVILAATRISLTGVGFEALIAGWWPSSCPLTDRQDLMAQHALHTSSPAPLAYPYHRTTAQASSGRHKRLLSSLLSLSARQSAESLSSAMRPMPARSVCSEQAAMCRAH